MKISKRHDYHGADRIHAQYPQILNDIADAVRPIVTAESCDVITKAVISNFVALNRGWRAEFWDFTPFRLQGSGRRAGIDLFHEHLRFAVEVELSNQTAMSHDLLKLMTCQRNGKCDGGMIITIERSVRNVFGFGTRSSASLHYETAHRWCDIFEKSLSFPFSLVALEA